MAKSRNVFKAKKEEEQQQKPKTKPNQSTAKKIFQRPQLSKRGNNFLGLALLLIGLYLLLAFSSYLFTWKTDQDAVFQLSENYFANADVKAENILGKFGAYISHLFFYSFIGISSFVIPFLLLAWSFYCFAEKKLFSLKKVFAYSFLAMLLLSLISSFLFAKSGFSWGGNFGNYTNEWLQSFIGKVGTGLLYLFALLAIVFTYFDIQLFPAKPETADELIDLEQATNTNDLQEDAKEPKNKFTAQQEEEIEVEVEEQPKIVHELNQNHTEEPEQEDEDNESEKESDDEKLSEDLNDTSENNQEQENS